MGTQKTRERQYQVCMDIFNDKGLTRFGLMSNQTWNDDPKRLTFLLSRYKFVAKMFSGMANVLEVGCADAFATRIVLQEVNNLTAIDFDPVFVEDVIKRMDQRWRFECVTHDILSGPVTGRFNGAYALDVLEHISKEDEECFIANIVQSLTADGVLIIGMPSLQSQTFASPPSKAGHINCMDHQSLKSLMSRFFRNIFLFSMNDEVVHTGFYPMANYFLALCCTKQIDGD